MWLLEHSHLRSLAFDITQHIIFKRGVAFLVLANCSLLAVPVTVSVSSSSYDRLAAPRESHELYKWVFISRR